MRIFDPKDQLGNSLLSSADTQKSSVKLEKQMTEGSTITLTSTDISDIENWELSNARVKVDGQMISFLPDTSRDTDGNLIVTLGETFSDVVLVLKRTVFDGMKQEEEVTIEVKIQRLMAKTMAAATAPTPRTQGQVDANIAEWKALGEEAVKEEPENYPYANCSNATELTDAGFDTGATAIGSDVCLISLDTVNNSTSGTRTFPNVENFEADLPSLKDGGYMFDNQRNLKTFTGKIPNITNAECMFCGCYGLTEWTVALPNSITNACGMFWLCTGLKSWTVELPNSITDASEMFAVCIGLKSFSTPSGTLPDSLTNASNMFMSCINLTSFQSDMPSGLTEATYMFGSCKLDKESLQKIASTIPDVKEVAGQHDITIGYDSSKTTTSEAKDFKDAIALKGWEVTMQSN